MNTLSRFGALLGIILGVVGSPFVSSALEYRVGDTPSFTANETLGDDLYMAGGTVTYLGELSGDLWSAGGTVLINGPVSQDVVAAGGTVSLLGSTGDDVRLAGGTIIVQGGVGNNLLIGGGTVTVAGPGVGGDAMIGAGTLRIDAPVGGDLTVGGGDVVINSRIAGNVEVHADTLTLGEQAVIEGNLSYFSPKEATIASGAVVRGETTHTYSRGSKDMREAATTGIAALATLAALVKLVSIFVGALIVALIFKRYAHEIVERSVSKPWKRIGVGIAFLIVVPVASIVLLFTVVGTIFGLIGLLAYAIAIMFSVVIVPIVLGSIVHKWIWKPAHYLVNWKTVLLGSVLFFVVGMIPVVGWIAVLALVLVSLGSMLSVKSQVAREWR